MQYSVKHQLKSFLIKYIIKYTAFYSFSNFLTFVTSKISEYILLVEDISNSSFSVLKIICVRKLHLV